MVVLVSMLVALFIAADPHDPVSEPPAQRPEPSAINPAAITSHPQLQSFIDASTDAILIVDNARVTAANQAARHLLGAISSARMCEWHSAMPVPSSACPIPTRSIPAIPFA